MKQRVVHSTHGFGYVSHEVGNMCLGEIRYYVMFDNSRLGVYDFDDLIFLPKGLVIYDYGHA